VQQEIVCQARNSSWAGWKMPDALYFWQWVWKMSCQGKDVSKTSCYPACTKAPPAC